jgi:predicted NBD/HSP70 family sugar kinase
VDPAWPSLQLVSAATDDHVLRALMRHRRLTRAELSTEIGISKPTAGESVRRLTERGLVVDTGDRTPGGRGRGRVGSYYSLSPAVGAALAVSIASEGVVAECVSVYGEPVARTQRHLDRPARPADVNAALEAAVAEVCAGAARPVRLAVVGAADPVDRDTGRLVHLPDSPFLVGDLDPVAVLSPHTTGTVIVDNDVNWAAQAERDHIGSVGGKAHLRDFAYLYLGDGLGCAIVNDGQIRRGRTGLTGEIAHLITTGPGGRAIPFIDLFGELGLRRPGSTAVDVERLLTAPTAVTDTLGEAISGVVAAIVALADPERIIVGGSWGTAVLDAVRTAVARTPRPVPVDPAELTTEPVLAGVRAEALRRLRAAVTAPTDQGQRQRHPS